MKKIEAGAKTCQRGISFFYYLLSYKYPVPVSLTQPTPPQASSTHPLQPILPQAFSHTPIYICEFTIVPTHRDERKPGGGSSNGFTYFVGLHIPMSFELL